MSYAYSANNDPYDSDKMAAEFLMSFNSQAFTQEQIMAFQFADKKLLGVFIKEIEGKINKCSDLF